MHNFEKTIIFARSGVSIYDALTKSILEWWTEMFEGEAKIQGQSFTIRFGTNVFKTMMVEELLPGKKVVWNCNASGENRIHS